MQIAEGISTIDLALYLKKQNIIILSDLHIGYEEALNKQGILIPRFHFSDMMQKAKKIFEGRKFKKIVINGDLKHEFGQISRQEWTDTLKFLDLCSQHSEEIVLIKGNHDTILGPIAEKKNLKLKNYEIIDDILIMHGDILPDFDIKSFRILIIGHEHPAISLRESFHTETFKCFLKGRFRKKILIVMPSFNLVTEGTDILKEQLLSPFLKGDISNFEVFIVGKETYFFGKVKNLINLESNLKKKKKKNKKKK